MAADVADFPLHKDRRAPDPPGDLRLLVVPDAAGKNLRWVELAIDVWEERAQRLYSEGRLDHPLHLDAFRNYCIETGRLRSFDEYLAEHGDVVEFKTGYSSQAPEVAMRKQASESALKWWKELIRVRPTRSTNVEDDEASDLMDS